MMKTISKLAVCSLILGMSISSSAWANVKKEINKTSDKQPVSYLFVQSANSALLKPIDQQKGQYSLTLIDVNPSVTYFSDRPNRITGVMSTEKFMQLWQKKGSDSFAQNAPNVSIEGLKLHYVFENKPVSFVAELLNPHMDAKTHEITYDIKVLGNHKNLENKPEKLNQVVLFLDNWCPSCCCGNA